MPWEAVPTTALPISASDHDGLQFSILSTGLGADGNLWTGSAHRGQSLGEVQGGLTTFKRVSLIPPQLLPYPPW